MVVVAALLIRRRQAATTSVDFVSDMQWDDQVE
jgi:hypothetical protein